jgi:uncharacterized Fe-S cluster-containing radical SAM superfamily protein
MPDKNIFCNAPWYELHIYWDGSLGFCCQEYHKIYPEQQAAQYNVRSMSIRDWFNSEPMKQARLSMFGNQKNSICHRCYQEEVHDSTSRRHRCNQKSVIFTRTAFDESYKQSPGFDKFERSRLDGGNYLGMPVDLHIDLGNHCNLACKMCKPQASSVIASQYVKWGMTDSRKFIGSDWTRDKDVWDRVLSELADIPNLRNVHFMGGETLITRRFEEFVDYMLSRGRTDLNFSFVTNGTTFNDRLLTKLKSFQRVGIEISIETADQRNVYQRQGTDQDLVMSNIKKYLDFCDGSSVTLTLRPAISALTIGTFHTLLRFAMQHNLVVKSLLVLRPDYLDVRILPDDVRRSYLHQYDLMLREFDLDIEDSSSDYNASDPNQLRKIIKNQIDQCRSVLVAPRLTNSDKLLQDMVLWCQKWDRVYGYDAVEIYPELADIFHKHGYTTA